jgi:class 3 adenylate cyclase
MRRAGDFAVAVPAVVLCADLSGFSVAGAALARSEARGAEELRGIVNVVFGQVTDAIQSAGGQVLQFSGDAVTAAWPTGDAPGLQAVCAIAAGLALQEACRNLSVAGMDALQMRVSLAQGQVWIAHLAEGATRRDTLICGDVFEAFRGQTGFKDGVFLDETLWAQVAPVARTRAMVAADDGGVRVLALDGAVPVPAVANDPADAAIIAGYVPDHLRALLDGVATDWLHRHRRPGEPRGGAVRG